MTIIDAHCHASPIWYEPVEALLFQMDRNGVERAVLTQLLGQFDNGYQTEAIARFPGRFAQVGAIDPSAPDAAERIAQGAARGMAGLRLRADARSPGANPLAVWRSAAQAGLAVSCAGSAAGFLTADFVELAAALPQMPFVLEHLAGWVRPDCDRAPATWQGILTLAHLPNVMVKVPGLGQIAPRPVGMTLPASGPVLDEKQGAILLELLSAFGADRLMWGSDFPLASSREGYGNALNWTREIFAARPAEEINAIFGGNADRIFFSHAA